jgi:hypothetical protein
VQSISRAASGALKAILDSQPIGPAKVAFAWRMAAGPTLAAATSVTWSHGRLRVRARTDEWRREVLRAKPVVLARLRELVGPDAVSTLIIED